jgi:hypothetical protein
MFNRLVIKIGFFKGEFIQKNKIITGKYILGFPVGNFIIQKNNDIYQGPYLFEDEIGIGEIIHSGIYRYQGSILKFEDFLRHGIGETIFDNGDKYQGNYDLDKMHGQGKLQKADGLIQEGIFFRSKLEEGYIILRNGDKITGKFNLYLCVDTKFTVEKDNGDKYVGTLNNYFYPTDIQYCQGILTKANGNIYSGYWINNNDNLPSLNVKIKYANGDYFVGEIYDNKYYGSFTYSNGDIYIGELVNQKRNKIGKLITDNITYECNWINDIKDGKGIKIIDGKIFNVFWKNDIEIDEEQPIKIKCPLCTKINEFILSKCKVRESNLNNNNICGICLTNVCNVTIPCQDMFCYDCVKYLDNI